MPASFEALVIAVLFLLPGLLYEAGSERTSGYWHARLPDRTFRYFRSSALFLLLFLIPLRALYHYYGGLPDLDRLLRMEGRRLVPLLVFLLVAMAVPYAVGCWTGLRRRRTSWRAPRAWDYLFLAKDLSGYVRVRLADGTWLGGLYTKTDSGPHSGYAAAYPDEPSLYLPVQVQLDPESGEVLLDDEGNAKLRQWGVLIDGATIVSLEFQPFAGP